MFVPRQDTHPILKNPPMPSSLSGASRAQELVRYPRELRHLSFSAQLRGSGKRARNDSSLNRCLTYAWSGKCH